MAKRRIAARIASGLFFAVVCLAMFDVPSAYAIARGQPAWLALIVGLATFPLLPLGWHAWGERARKRRIAAAKTPQKALTTGWERLALRGGVVGVLVIGALIAADRDGVWNAVKRHAWWFVPRQTAMIVPDAQILSHLPPDTEGLVWLRPTSELRESLGSVVPQLADPPEVVLAIGGTDARTVAGVVLERGPSDLIDSIEQLLKMSESYGIVAPPDRTNTTLGDGTRAWTTKAWSGALDRGKPTALLDLLRGVPDDAFVVAVARPSHVLPTEVRSVVAYAHPADDFTRLEAIVELEARNEAVARTLADEAVAALDHERKRSPDAETACIDASGAERTITHDGAHVHIRYAIRVDAIRPLFECLDAR